ncbi:MAG: CoA-substrate-specific enzyme activase [Candidatus Aminicenantes bacterium]|nr:CoA-substrate-specific enzyme activase [Candidatus Aminicenantes bacterium]
MVVVGRPYNTLDEVLSQNVPSYVAECGTTVIPMSCLPFRPELVDGEFDNLFWTNGQKILSVLRQVAESEGMYAIYLSNFSCGPDSFLLNYAEAIMDGKPFLILELDEHGSAGAYQTRIEAFLDVVRADGNARKSHVSGWSSPREPDGPPDLKNRTIWIPPMHPVGNRLFAAAFRRRGYDARVLPEEDDATFSLGKKWTRGAECLPAPLTLGVFLKQMEKERAKGQGLDGRHALFLPTSDGPCRYGQYRTLDRIILDRQGLQDVLILSPGAHNAYYGLERRLREQLWDAILASDILFKMRCRVRPYEAFKGQADAALKTWTARAESRIEKGSIDWRALLTQAMRDFQRIAVPSKKRPLVGIVGEIYVRCSGYANDRVVETIEELGGEAWLAPVSEWILYTAWMERYLSRRARSGPRRSLETALKWRYLTAREHRMYRLAEPLLGSRTEPDISETIAAGRPYVPVDFEGESILTLGRAVLFARQGVDVVVNCAPFGCMHGNITSAVFDRISETIGIPVVNTFYDGMGGNSLLPTFLHGAFRKP